MICVYFTEFSQPRKEANVRYWILGVLDNRDPTSALGRGLKRGAAASRQVLARSALAVITAPILHFPPSPTPAPLILAHKERSAAADLEVSGPRAPTQLRSGISAHTLRHTPSLRRQADLQVALLSLGLPMEGDRVAEKATRVRRLLHHQESGVQVESEGDPAASRHHQGQGAEHPARVAGRAAGAGAHGCEREPGREKTQEGSALGVVNGSPAPGAARGHPSPQRHCARSPRQFLALVQPASRLLWGGASLILSRSVDLLSRWSGGQVTVPDSGHPAP